MLLPTPAEGDAGGISRKIDDSRERQRLRDLLKDIAPEEGSVILRTAAVDQDDESVLSDAEFLKRTWERVQAAFQKAKGPTLLHNDYDILWRLVRDVFTDNIDEIAIDDTAEHARMVKILRQFLPKLKHRVLLYPSTRNIFEVFDIERQIYKALRKRVWLRSGGHVIFDECEALSAIDVNTGKYVGKGDQEATVLRTNLEAVRVIARQLKLRDIGGIIIIDFIDMRKREHREEVLRELRRCLRLDRARTTASEITNLGLVEMTRKRVRHSLRKTLQRECPHCGGNGMILSSHSIWRVLRNAVLSFIEDHPDHDIRLRIHPEIHAECDKEHLAPFREIEDEHGITITVEAGDIDHQEIHIIEGTPHDGRRRKVTVTGKRFSFAEEEAAAATASKRRRKSPARRSTTAAAPTVTADDALATLEAMGEESAAEKEEAPAKPKRRRGTRGGARAKKTDAKTETDEETPTEVSDAEEGDGAEEKETTAKPRRRRGKRGGVRTRKKSAAKTETEGDEETPPETPDDDAGDDTEEKEPPKKTRRGRRGGARTRKTDDETPAETPADDGGDDAEEKKSSDKPPRRSVRAERTDDEKTEAKPASDDTANAAALAILEGESLSGRMATPEKVTAEE